MPDKIPKRPYLDSDVFIGWIKGEKVPGKDDLGNEIIIDRGKIAESILTLAEQQVFPIVISGLTLAEVHKRRGKEKLSGDENDNVLEYFEHDFVTVVPVDRRIGEEANRLCRKYEKEGLSPNDAIHLACAKEAGCDVLLSWDKVLNNINDPGIPTKRPETLDVTPPQRELELFPVEESEQPVKDQAPELSGDGGHSESQTGAEATKDKRSEALDPKASEMADATIPPSKEPEPKAGLSATGKPTKADDLEGATEGATGATKLPSAEPEEAVAKKAADLATPPSVAEQSKK